MLKFNLILFLISSGILIFVLKYRIHVHVTYTTSSRRATAPKLLGRARATTRLETSQPSFAPGLKQDGPKPTSLGRPAIGPSLQSDLKSALVNLGCKPKRASEVAAKISQQFTPKDFDRALRVAIREAA